MDRPIVYPAEMPTETDFLYGGRFSYEAFGLMVRDLIGSGTSVAGLACAPTTPASMTVNVGPGRIYMLANLEPTPIGQIAGLGGLPADTNPDHQIIKQGLLRDTTLVGGSGSPFTAPGTAGQSINYLIQAQFVTADSTPSQRTYYNSQNPTVPIPSNVSNFRTDQLVLSVKAGSPATTGSQVTPTADAGCVPVWVITVANGQTTIASGNIVKHGSAPFFSLISTATGLATVSGGAVSVLEALAADVRAGTSTTKVMTPGDTYGGLAEVPLTDNPGGTVAVDFSTFINAVLPFTGTGNSRTLGNPTNPKVGQEGVIRLPQSSGGSNAMSYGGNWKRQGGPPVLTTTASATDLLIYKVITPTFILYNVALNPS